MAANKLVPHDRVHAPTWSVSCAYGQMPLRDVAEADERFDCGVVHCVSLLRCAGAIAWPERNVVAPQARVNHTRLRGLELCLFNKQPMICPRK